MKFQKSRIIALGSVVGLVTCVYATDALYVDPTGNVGVGTSSPTRKLQVEAVDSANIYVKNTSTVNASRTMFILENKGKTRFQIANGTGSWTFDNAGTKFQINRVGTGIPEFELYENGDGYFKGDVYANEVLLTSARDSKTDFEAVDSEEVLKLLDQLDVLSWRYKTDGVADRHIGPIAEDFRDVFSMGDGAHISAVDTSGIAFAAIKGLNSEAQIHAAKLESLEAKNSELVASNADLESRLRILEDLLMNTKSAAAD